MQTKADISKYVVNVQGKDYITFPGLLAEAHAQGLTEIQTELQLPLDLTNPIVKATVKFADKSFTGYGDANANNVAKKVAGALIRMAETRAVARALRFACNIDMTALEELDVESDKISKKEQTPQTFKAPAVAAPKVETVPAPVATEAPKVSTPAPKTTAKSFGAAPVVAPTVAPAGPALGKRKAAATEPNFP